MFPDPFRSHGCALFGDNRLINEKIINAESIITKLIRNKDETLNALNTQLNTIKKSLSETTSMLANTQAGLNKMHQNIIDQFEE